MVSWENQRETLMFLPVFGLFALIFIFPSAGKYIFVFGAVMIIGASAGQERFAEWQASTINVIRATIRSIFTYAGNAVLQFFFIEAPKTEDIPPDRFGNIYLSEINLIPPYPIHPKFGKIKRFKLLHKLPLRFLFTQGPGRISFWGMSVKHPRMDLCTLFEITEEQNTPEIVNFEAVPTYMVWEATGTFPFAMNPDARNDMKKIRELEATVRSRSG